jgi:hypothetical protein
MSIPYVNQLDNAPRGNDCGPACVAMLAGAVRPELANGATVTDLSRRFDAPQDGTTQRDLLMMGQSVGVALKPTTGAEYPYIALVDYRLLPVRLQSGGNFAHWIVRLSSTSYHDPLWRGNAGAHIQTTQAVLDQAEAGARRWSSVVPNRVTLKEVPMTQTSGKARIGATAWNVRRAPSTASATATGYLLQPGQEFDVAGMVTGADGMQWGRTSVTIGGVRVTDGYLRADGWRWVSTTTPPQPVAPAPQPGGWTHAKYLLGVSCLNDGDAGMDALARGCRSVLFMDNLMGAAAAARQYPDAKIMARFWFQSAPDPAWLADHAGAGLANVPGNMWTTCANEGDWIGYGNADELRRRFDYERTFAQAMWAKNPSRKIVIGEFSHGTPDITNPDIVRAYKETYYAFAAQNAGRVQVGWHLYTKGKRFADAPPADAPVIAPEWFEGRDASFWQAGGGSKSVVHTCGETGVEAGAGGFPWAGYSDDQFARWCSWWLGYRRSLPVVMDGVCLFQIGAHQGWRGYDVRRYVGILTDFWQGRRS